MKTSFNIFVPHCSDMLTDHLPHGDGLTAYGFLSRLASRGHRLHVAVQSAAFREPVHPNITLYHLGKRTSSLLGRAAFMVSVRRLFNRLSGSQEFDLIHQFNPVFTGVSLALVGSNKPLVLVTYVSRWPDQGLTTLRTRVVRCGFNAIHTVTARIQQSQADVLLVTTPAALDRIPAADSRRERIRFLRHGVDTSLFTVGESRPHLSEPVILFLANVSARKGIFTLLEAFEIVSRSFPEARLRIVGDGPDLREVTIRSFLLDSNERIEFFGRQDRQGVRKHFQDSTIYCLPSYGEPFGMSLLEAMACGKPIVSTNSGGAPHLLESQGSILVPYGDPHKLADALMELLNDPARQARMGAINRQAAEAMSWDRVVTELEQIYQETLDSHRLLRREKADGVANSFSRQLARRSTESRSPEGMQ